MNFDSVSDHTNVKLHQIIGDHIWGCYWEQIRIGGSK